MDQLPMVMGLGGKTYLDARPPKSRQGQPTLAEILRQIRPDIGIPEQNPALAAPGAPAYQDPYLKDQYATDLSTYNQPLPPSPNPFAGNLAQIEGQKASIAQSLMGEDTTPQHVFSPYTPPPAIPYNPPSIPERQTPQFNPVAGGLAALAGFIAPQGASQFNDAALGGSIQQANQHYQDALTRHQLQLQDYQAQHEQQIRDRDEMIRIGVSNLRGKEQADYLNAVGRNDFQKARDLLKANAAGLDVEGTALGKAAQEQQAYTAAATAKAQAGANLKAAADRALKASQEATKQFIANESNKTKLKYGAMGVTKSEYGADKRLEGTKYTADKRSGDVVYRADKALAGVQTRARASTDPYTRLQLASLQQRRISTGLELTAAQKTLHDMFSTKIQKDEAKQAEQAALSKLEGIEQETIEFAKGLPATPGMTGKGSKASPKADPLGVR